MTADQTPGFLCASDDLPEDELRELGYEHRGRPQHLIAARLDGRARAWRNSCPHQGRCLNYAPGKFLRDGAGRLVCAAHGAVFELEEGRCVEGPCKGERLEPVELVERNGSVLVSAQHTSPGEGGLRKPG